ncbi:hypothetical protein CRM22_006705 [Opisthorchis felineus]|uniref:Integrase zinc-binding domain-containing protein n=1 Tax=Opisthorchis felineus TaxID=147828 RepID=A0A4S2LJM2_OPIFE|nr:hypothetical protein CRM22_006705 [Opisthorchis felineus]
MLKLEGTGRIGERIARNHNLVRLCPVMIDGLSCVRGRLDNLMWPPVAKHPIILPPKHNITRLIVWNAHMMNGHCGLSHMLSGLRRSCWIVQEVSMARRVLHGFWMCRRLLIMASRQVMVPPSIDRIQPGWHPFKWPLGVADECETPSYSSVKTAVVRTRDGGLRRDVHKIGLVEGCE